MTQLIQWAIRHNIPHSALAELRQMMGIDKDTDPDTTGDESGEALVQVQVRLEATRAGARIWRNNNGACKDDTGRVIRYGLVNDSAALNKRIKSSDLIGIRPVVITSDMIGHTIGQFIAREIKKPGWKYTGTDREKAQLAFIELVMSLGGDAAFANDVGSI